MSMTAAVTSGLREAVAPVKLSDASSRPEIARQCQPKRARTSARKAWPSTASRTALVATAQTGIPVSCPFQRSMAAKDASIPAGDKWCVSSISFPSRVVASSFGEKIHVPGTSCQPVMRRRELEPISMTAYF